MVHLSSSSTVRTILKLNHTPLRKFGAAQLTGEKVALPALKNAVQNTAGLLDLSGADLLYIVHALQHVLVARPTSILACMSAFS